MAFKDDFKQFFETGDKPTQAQFASLFEKLRWKDENLEIENVNNLMQILLGKADDATLQQLIGEQELKLYDADGPYTIAAGYLIEKVIIMPGVNADISIGSSPDFPEDITPLTSMDSNRGEVVILNLFARAERIIHFFGLPAGSSIVFFKKKILSQ